MSVKSVRLAHDVAVIAAELENAEANLVSVTTCINETSSAYIKKILMDKLDNLISQRNNLINRLNETLDNYNKYVELLKS